MRSDKSVMSKPAGAGRGKKSALALVPPSPNAAGNAALDKAMAAARIKENPYASKATVEAAAAKAALDKAMAEAKEADRAAKAAKTAAVLASLPNDLGRGRIVDASAAAMFWGVSLPHWRRLYRLGRVPAPIKIGERKLGWRVGDLADGIASRQTAAA